MGQEAGPVRILGPRGLADALDLHAPAALADGGRAPRASGSGSGIARFWPSTARSSTGLWRQSTNAARCRPASWSLGERGQGGWWGWSEAKRATRCLFWARRADHSHPARTFERVYGLPEEVLPKARSGRCRLPSVPRYLILAGAARPGQGAPPSATCATTSADDPWRRPTRRRRVGRERRPGPGQSGRLGPGGSSGFDARRPRKIVATALLSPFEQPDLVPGAAERLLDVRIRLEIYTPAHKRTHGYYVLLLPAGRGDHRPGGPEGQTQAGLLRGSSPPTASQTANAVTAPALAAELRLTAEWLGLAGVAVAAGGD